MERLHLGNTQDTQRTEYKEPGRVHDTVQQAVLSEHDQSMVADTRRI